MPKVKAASQLSSTIAVISEVLQCLNNSKLKSTGCHFTAQYRKKYLLLNTELQKSMLYYLLCTSQGEVIHMVIVFKTFFIPFYKRVFKLEGEKRIFPLDGDNVLCCTATSVL